MSLFWISNFFAPKIRFPIDKRKKLELNVSQNSIFHTSRDQSITAFKLFQVNPSYSPFQEGEARRRGRRNRVGSAGPQFSKRRNKQNGIICCFSSSKHWYTWHGCEAVNGAPPQLLGIFRPGGGWRVPHALFFTRAYDSCTLLTFCR